MTPMTPNYGAGFGNAINDKMRRKAGIERNSGKKHRMPDGSMMPGAKHKANRGPKRASSSRKTKGGYR